MGPRRLPSTRLTHCGRETLRRTSRQTPQVAKPQAARRAGDFAAVHGLRGQASERSMRSDSRPREVSVSDLGGSLRVTCDAQFKPPAGELSPSVAALASPVPTPQQNDKSDDCHRMWRQPAAPRDRRADRRSGSHIVRVDSPGAGSAKATTASLVSVPTSPWPPAATTTYWRPARRRSSAWPWPTREAGPATVRRRSPHRTRADSDPSSRR